MQIEHLEIEPGMYKTGTIPLLYQGETASAEIIAAHEFQLQVRSLDGTLLGTGSTEIDGSNLRWSIDAELVATMTSGVNQLWRVLVKETSTGAYGPLRGGTIKLKGLDFSWQ